MNGDNYVMKRPPNLIAILQDFSQRIADDADVKAYGDARIYSDSYDMIMFPQTWGSTALGFGGWGGQAVTQEYTTVVKFSPSKIYGVYFSDKFAYIVKKPNKTFADDVNKREMKSAGDSHMYEVL